jgi:choline/ethanolamine kinase
MNFYELIFTNDCDQFPYFEYDYDLFPSQEFQTNFIKTYIDEFKSKFPDHMHQQIEKEYKLNVEDILIEANYYGLLANLYLAIWSIVQASSSNIKFGYMVNIYLCNFKHF